MIAACLGLEWLPIAGGILSATQCARLKKHATRPATTARLIFTAVWSAVTVIGYLTHLIFASFHPMTIQHLTTVGTGIVLIGWALVAAAVLQGLKLANEIQNKFVKEPSK